MIDLKIISGTDRPDSNALRVSKYLQKKYRALEVEADIIDLRDFPTAEVAGGKYRNRPEKVRAFIRPIVEAEAITIVCPEYNGGYPGILKLCIDYLPFPEALSNKPISFVGEANGAFGAVRAVEQLQQVVGYRNAHVYPERVFIPRINMNFDDERGILDEFQQSLLESQISGFVDFVHNLGGNKEPK